MWVWWCDIYVVTGTGTAQPSPRWARTAHPSPITHWWAQLILLHPSPTDRHSTSFTQMGTYSSSFTHHPLMGTAHPPSPITHWWAQHILHPDGHVQLILHPSPTDGHSSSSFTHHPLIGTAHPSPITYWWAQLILHSSPTDGHSSSSSTHHPLHPSPTDGHSSSFTHHPLMGTAHPSPITHWWAQLILHPSPTDGCSYCNSPVTFKWALLVSLPSTGCNPDVMTMFLFCDL